MAEYCNDHFKMVEDTDDSFRMWQGLVGPCYTPVLSNDGTLSWTNNANLPNPEAVNIRGPQGAGIRIAGIVDSEESLPASAADGAIWLVGEGSPYEGYAWISSGWIDLGPLTVGPAGPPGPQGDDYELTEADKQEIAEISESILLTELDNEPLGVRYGGTGARTVEGAKQMLGIDEITDKLGTWPLGTDAQDVAGAINEMIGEIDLQVADIEQLKNNFAGEFSPTSTYTVGTYVVYDGAFWRCTTAVTTAGSWTGASNWTQVTAGGEFVDVRGIIGTSPLNTTAQTLTGAINEHETDISALDTALSGKVSKSGGTMTGNLTLDSGRSLHIKAGYQSNGTYTSNQWASQIQFDDSVGANIAMFRTGHYANGIEITELFTRRVVNGSDFYNALQLRIASDGKRSVTFTELDPWRKALGLTYAANDTYSATSVQFAGFISSNSKEVAFTVPVERSMENITSVSVTTLTGLFRTHSGYVDNVSTSSSWLSGYTVTANKRSNNLVQVSVQKSSALANVTANSVATASVNITLKFT